MTTAIVFDTETTGLTKPEGTPLGQQPQIIEICCIKLDDDLNEIDSYETFINPGKPIDDEITSITGITNEDVCNAPKFEEIYADLAGFFLGTEILVAHNLPFDRNLLSYELRRMDKLRNFPWPIHHMCTINKAQKLFGYRIKLGDLYKEATGKDHAKAHRARGDVEATIECFTWLANKGVL